MPRLENRRNFTEYAQMLEDSSARLMQIEKHLQDLVLIEKRSNARVYQSTHRIVEAINDDPSGGGAILRFKVPQGESWRVEKLFLSGMGATAQGYAYMGAVITHNIAAVVTSDANGFFADSGKRHLFVPERVDLIITGATGARAQIEVIKQYAMAIPSEEVFALRGPETEYENRETEIRAGIEADQPEPERHDQDEEGGLGFAEEDVRPQPHLSEQLAAVAHRVEETFTDLI